MRLRDEVALVTGGGTGIGRAIALALAAEGCRVAIAGRREERLREVVAAWRGEQPMLHRVADVSNRDSVDALQAWVVERLGPVHLLINAAGINVTNRSLGLTEPAEWDSVLAVNLTGCYNCMRSVLPGMLDQGNGLIVNVSSVAGLRGDTSSGVAYIASKFAMGALGTVAALEYGRRGVRITTICLGDVDTPLLDLRSRPPTAAERSVMIQPEDVAAAVIMVACLPRRAHVAQIIMKPAAEDLD
jgi:NAD(P)-dependent dehydrogenase (short-subunit alcohol dehydrogenase family)